MDQYGICRLAVVPVRKEPTDKSEMVTQLLFGEHYTVLEYDTQWVKIKISFDGYEGWIDNHQHKDISLDYYNYLETVELKVCTDIVTAILYKNKNLNILIGSLLPISSTELFRMEEQLAFNGEAKNMGKKMDAQFMRLIASKYLNAPYLWGGKSPFGIDCSGFTQQVFKICGYRLLRDASQQVVQGRVVETLAEAQEGDMVFFMNGKGYVSHVGILLEDNKIIHASGRVRIDDITDKGIINIESGQYSHTEICAIRRVLL